MAKATGTMTIPIIAGVGKTAVHLGNVVVDVKVVRGKVKTPSERDIRAALRKGLR